MLQSQIQFHDKIRSFQSRLTSSAHKIVKRNGIESKLPLKMPIYQPHHLSTQIIESAGVSISGLRQALWSHLHPARQASHTMLSPVIKEEALNIRTNLTPMELTGYILIDIYIY